MHVKRGPATAVQLLRTNVHDWQQQHAVNHNHSMHAAALSACMPNPEKRSVTDIVVAIDRKYYIHPRNLLSQQTNQVRDIFSINCDKF